MTERERKLLNYAIGLIGLIGGRLLFNHFWPQSASRPEPMGSAFAAEVERQGFTALWNDRFSSINDPAEAGRIGGLLVRKGVGRLPADELLERAIIQMHADSLAGDSLCAARFMGTLQPSSVDAYFGRLDAWQQMRLMTITVHALHAELIAADSLVPVTHTEWRSALVNVAASQPDSIMTEWGAIMDHLSQSSPSRQCWASMAMTRTIRTMPRERQSAVLSVLARVEAGS